MSKTKRKPTPKAILRLPDLERSKSAALNSLASQSSQRSYDHAIPGLRQRPRNTGRLGGGHVFMDGALGNGTTAGDLMPAQSKGMEPQNFLQLAHGQPLLGQLGSPLPVESNRHGCPAPPFQSDADQRSELQP